MNGTDFQGLARALTARTEIPVFSVPTSGMHDYVYGAGLALAEIAKVFPVFARRLKFTQGLSLVIVSIAAGKTLGSLFYYAKGWM